MNKRMIVINELGRMCKQSWSILRHYLSIFLEELRRPQQISG